MFARRDGDAGNFAQRVSFGWRELPVPVIAALQGACFGGGLQIALGADIRIAAPDTRLSVMEIRYGLVPDMGLSQALPGLVRADLARELVYSGRIVDADEALRLGLVTRIEADPLAAARALASEIAARSPDAIRAAKRLANEAWGAPAGAGLALEAELQRALIGSPNQLAAVQAALSGETPEFADPPA
jgi:enoyl-CoA hydratase/carnithine racemase